MSKPRRPRYTYSLLDVLRASPTEPMPEAVRTRHLLHIYDAMANLERLPAPSHRDWSFCTEPINVMEQLVTAGVCEDKTNLLGDAVTALATAYRRHVEKGLPIRMDGAGTVAVRAVLRAYSGVLETAPHRTVVAAHHKTERRIRDMLTGKGRAHDVLVVGI